MATGDFEPEPPSNFPRELGVEDIGDGDLQTLTSCIQHVVGRDLPTTVTEIFVMGSFARGEARRLFSDLDLRVVVTGWSPEDEREAVADTLKTEYGPDVTPEVCGYLDVHITNLQPTGDEPSVCIYRD
jgi:hypothetical protein